jgi:hypothetical protein
LPDGRLLHTHKATFAQRHSLDTWPNFEAGHIKWPQTEDWACEGRSTTERQRDIQQVKKPFGDCVKDNAAKGEQRHIKHSFGDGASIRSSHPIGRRSRCG